MYKTGHTAIRLSSNVESKHKF